MAGPRPKRLKIPPEKIGDIHIIDSSNYEDAHLAMRDILFMYHEHIDSTAGYVDEQTSFIVDVDVGLFDPFLYLKCREVAGVSFGCDARLLMEGSVIAIISQIINELSFESAECPNVKRAAYLLQRAGFRHIPSGESALEALIRGKGEGDPAVIAAFQELVIGFFRTFLSPTWHSKVPAV